MFQKFCAIQSYPLPKLVKFSPILCNFILGPCIAKKITQVLSYVVGTQVRRHVHKQFTKRRYGEEKPGRFVFGKPVLFTLGLGLTSLTPWVFLSKIFPDIRHCVYLVLDEIWAPDSCHKIGNNFFIHHCKSWKEGSFVCETVWFFSLVSTHLFDLKFVAFIPKFSADSYVEFQEKTISGEFFINFVQTKAIIYQNLWNFALLSAILFWTRVALKKSHK